MCYLVTQILNAIFYSHSVDNSYLPSASLLPADFEFSFGQVSRLVGAGSDGNEATDGSTSSDIGVGIVLNIISSANFLTADTNITVTVSGGTATGMPVSSL